MGSLAKFAKATDGASLIEFGLIAFFLLLLTLGTVDFIFAFYQWNTATKAVQQGARLAAVSDPVASDLTGWMGLEGGGAPSDPMPAFDRVCSGATASCTGGTYDAAAMNNLIFGRGSTSCRDGGSFAGMCDIFQTFGPGGAQDLGPANVIVRYTGTGLGYVGRPLGPVPTITVELTGLSFNLIFLNGLLGLGPIPMPRLHTTVTGEDLSTSF